MFKLKRLSINRLYKLQFEKKLNNYVLLYPEGMVTLNESSSEILKLCNGKNTIDDIKQNLLQRYNSIDGLDDFIQDALKNDWLKEK